MVVPGFYHTFFKQKVLSGEDRGLISRTAVCNRAFPSDNVFLGEHNDFYYDYKVSFLSRSPIFFFSLTKDLTLFSTLLPAGSARFKDLMAENLILVASTRRSFSCYCLGGKGGAGSELLFDFSTYTCIFSDHSFTF